MSDTYCLAETKTGKMIGRMCAFPVDNNKRIYNIPENAKNYRIYSLEIKESERKKGWGTYFMNFAKKQSYNEGCEGRLYLVAYNSVRAPHCFYKKQGLVAIDKMVDKKLSNCTTQHINSMWRPPCDMYLPLDKTIIEQKAVKNKSFISLIKKYFCIKK